MPVGTASAAPALRWPRAAAWIVVAAIVLHVAVFIDRVANPLVISDAWYYIDSFLRKYVDGQLTLGDFFARRSAADHALPFHKLLLLINYRAFDVDLSVDAWIGFAFALVTLWMLREAIRRSTPAAAFAAWPVQAAWVAACAVYLSVNSTQVFNWPLLTLSFVALFCCVVLFWLSWRAVMGGRWAPLVPVVLVLMLVSDDGGAIAVIAAALAALLLGLRAGRRRAAVGVVVVLLVGCFAYKAGLRWLGPPVAAGNGVDLHALLAQLHPSAGLLSALAVPFSAGVLHDVPAEAVFHRRAGAVVLALGLLLVVAHGLFWGQAWRRRPTVAWFLAVALMLLFYGLCAGVLVGRGPQFGVGVLDQPRYVVFYELQVVALLLMAACWLGERPTDSAVVRGRRELAVATACLGLVLLQVPIDRAAWQRAFYERRYVEQLAAQMDALASAPAIAPAGCLPQLTVCRMPPPVRVRAVVFLRDHALNLYSPAFRRRHHFDGE